MKKDNIVPLDFPENSSLTHDLLTQTLREGAQKLLSLAVEAEVIEFLNTHQQTLDNGQARLVRNGYLPEREITTGIGPIKAKVARVRDRGEGEDKLKFESTIIPKYLRRSGDMNELLPLLYLKGLSTNEFVEALTPVVGEQAKNLSGSVISRLKSKWTQEYESWCKRDLSQKHYVYWWVDGIHLKVRMAHEKQCVLVIIGVTESGNKELMTLQGGFRESKESWLSLLEDLRHRGLENPPRLAVGDGALGFWNALDEMFPGTKHQRCWFHKMGNVLDKLPKSLQSKATKDLQNIWMAQTREEAKKAFKHFIRLYGAKYPKATECLEKDREALLAFYDYPAEHWAHLRTTNPIESTFATVRHRTRKSKNCHSYETILTMVFKLVGSAQNRWRKLRGFRQLGDVIRNVKFKDGIKVDIKDKNQQTRKQSNAA